MKFKVEVNTYGDPAGSWTGNAILHDSVEAATKAAKDLYSLWAAVESWRVVDTEGNVHAPSSAM